MSVPIWKSRGEEGRRRVEDVRDILEPVVMDSLLNELSYAVEDVQEALEDMAGCEDERRLLREVLEDIIDVAEEAVEGRGRRGADVLSAVDKGRKVLAGYTLEELGGT